MVKPVRVTRRGADRVAAGHLWIYASDVADRGLAQSGDTVTVLGPREEFLGVAHYSSASQIALRLLSTRQRPADRAFFEERLQAAIARRQHLTGTNACRLVHGEGDFLPGLMVDRYDDVLVIQTLSQGMDRAKPEIVAVLQELLQPRSIIERNDAASRDREALPRLAGVLAGEPLERVAIRMNGLSLEVDPLHGQKTGAFLDQRENYVAAAAVARGHALDCFTGGGGFALHLASSCDTVLGVDSSTAAIESARRNARINSLANAEFLEADVFSLLAGYHAARRRFDTVVLDPPAFAKTRASVEAALRAYAEINRRALHLLPPGGVLITCSCSYHVTEADLLQTLAEAGLSQGMLLRVRERRSQASDHPILLTVPETQYLKCLIVEPAPL